MCRNASIIGIAGIITQGMVAYGEVYTHGAEHWLQSFVKHLRKGLVEIIICAKKNAAVHVEGKCEQYGDLCMKVVRNNIIHHAISMKHDKKSPWPAVTDDPENPAMKVRLFEPLPCSCFSRCSVLASSRSFIYFAF